MATMQLTGGPGGSEVSQITEVTQQVTRATRRSLGFTTSGSLTGAKKSVMATDPSLTSVNGSRKTLPEVEVKATGSKKLIDILNPAREPLPVILPKIGDSRRKVLPLRCNNNGRTGRSQELDDDIVPTVEGDNARNPFEYPRNIEDFIAQVELERAEQRKLEAHVPPLMKGTNLFKQNQIVLARIKPFLQPTFKHSSADEYKNVVWEAQHGLRINHLQKVSRKMHTEYIMQRKDIYYLRRAIRARKIALDMVQKNRELEESCLKDYEWLTDFTKEAFETFLRENDDETHAASRKAEVALKEKLEKTLEVRQLNIQINQLKTDIIGTNESLRECKSYMKFLDDIAREIMRKDEEEEIRAQHREQQIKEEIIGYLKQGMSLKKAQKMVEKKAQEFQDDQWQLGKQSQRGSFGSGSADFIAALNRQIRKHLGFSEEPTDHPHRKSLDKSEKHKAKEASSTKEGFVSPRSIISALVSRSQSRLVQVLTQNEMTGAFAKKPEPEPTEHPHVDHHGHGHHDQHHEHDPSHPAAPAGEDEDGYDEKGIVSSLDLVPGNEATDRQELANLSFTRPSQLLQIYSDMEEANLSLIQHSQASEELLERVNHQISNTRRALNHRGRLLRNEINKMQANIDLNEERAQALTMLMEMFTGGNYDVRQQQRLYRILQRHVANVYKTAVGSIDHHLNPIMMLTSVEKNFEDLMREIQAMPTDVVVQISRELDKERREMERIEKMNQRKQVQEERKSRQIERAKAPIRRRKGRPLLARSHPPKAIIHLSQAELDKKAEEDEYNYFFGP